MVELLRLQTGRLLFVLRGPEGHPALEDTSPIRLREQTGYSLFLRSLTGEAASVEHPDPVLLRGLHRAEGAEIVYGDINFGSQVGHTDLALQVGAERTLLALEVLPTKLDYRADYAQLVTETQEILSGLVLEHLRSTFQLGSPQPAPHPTRLEWLAVLRQVVDDLERALAHLARHPVRGLAAEPEEVRAERARRPDPALRRAVARGIGGGEAVSLRAGVHLRERIPHRGPQSTLDTPEHRWLADRLHQLRRGIARLREQEAGRARGERGARLLAELDLLEERIVRLARLEPLAAATAAAPPNFASLQLLSAPGYREAHRAILALTQGIVLEGGPVRTALKELHQLYEYWCYLTVVRVVAEELDAPLPAAQLLAVEQRGLRVTLRRGHEHAVRLGTPAGRVTLTYNPRFGAEPLLVPQQPDILLGIRRADGTAFHAVLDAKYRIDTSSEYQRRYGSPGPPEEALNTLHRYRDALVGAGGPPPAAGPERMVHSAVALFPHREERGRPFRESRLWSSLHRLGVGAIPLLPGGAGYLTEWLREVLRRNL